jgi:hypothetical protein
VQGIENEEFLYGILFQWCTEGRFEGSNFPLKFHSFDRAKPNSQFCGKYTM